jgi:hypothetical protein
MLRHADGRVSAYMHLSKVVVGLDQEVRQGQVIAYVGSTGSSGNPHLHFDVQPNTVDRECVALTGLDELNYRAGWAVSHNLPWDQLTLLDPPAAIPGWLPTLALSGTLAPGQVVLPAGLTLSPTTSIAVRVAAPAGLEGLSVDNIVITPTRSLTNTVWFNLSFTAPQDGGVYTQTVQPLIGGGPAGPGAILTVTVRAAADARPAAGLIWINPTFVSPPDWSRQSVAPRLCWSETPQAGKAPFQFRAMVVGPATADSGWIAATCWQTPALPAGTYFWKVFVRDACGYMNRTNQRPLAFTIK